MVASAQNEIRGFASTKNAEQRIASPPEALGGLLERTSADGAREGPPTFAHRDEILAKVTHELRTPLSSILMTTSFLLDDLVIAHPGVSLRCHLEAIQSAGRVMARLVEDLLDVSTHESGCLVLRRAPLRVTDLFTRADTVLRPIAAARNITLMFAQEQSVPAFHADERRLLQVIVNLAGNAIKFSQPGGHIVVAVRAELDHVVFRVSDTGAGISATDLPRVFDRYWQAPEARHAGVGLGLAIVREIVDAHGGRVEVNSTVGVGTTFIVTVPCR